MSKYSFPCGCEFEIVGEIDDGRPAIDFVPKIDKINLDCSRTWDLLGAGNTKGCFQLESRLGQSLAKKLKPKNMEQLSALVSIMRPGCLEAVRDGKTVTQHYIDRKNGVEEVSYFHPALKPALENTYGEMVYQEQAMRIARDIAGFTLGQADELRKAIGKKKPELMAKMKLLFIEGAKNLNIVDEEQAEQIFGWIEKSQRYSFNKAHGFSYALNAYLSAYTKAHFGRAFFTSYLGHAKGKMKPFMEIHELVQNAKTMGIEILSPDFRRLNKHFKLIDKKVYFGFFDMKGVGESAYKNILKQVENVEKLLGKTRDKWTWVDFLVHFSQSVNCTAINAVINSGALAYMGLGRTQMTYELGLYSKLTTREMEWVKTYIKHRDSSILTLEHLLKMMVSFPTGSKNPGACCSSEARRKQVRVLLDLLMEPPHSLKDTAEWIASIEHSLMGIAITCTAIDGCNIESANCTCQEFSSMVQGKQPIIIAAQIDKVNKIKTKTGKNKGAEMAFLTISDITGAVDNTVIFPNVYEEYKNLLFENNKVMIHGECGKENSFVINQIWQI